MQNIEQQIDLDLDNDNELVFKLAIEGTKNASTSSRLLIESEEYSLVFPATSLSKGEVCVNIPPLENILESGNYKGTLEVIVDDRVFIPVILDAKFEKSISVFAEALVKKRRETTVSISAPVTVRGKEKSSVSSEIKETVSRKRPPQRNRKRPAKTSRRVNESVSKVSSNQGLVHRIKSLISEQDVQLSDSQIEAIAKKYKHIMSGKKNV
jgi:hypothetical protein